MPRTAVVTGASSGIGAALARELAIAGWSLLVTARRIERLEVLQQELEEKHGVVVRIHAADLADEADRAGLIVATEALGDELGCLVHAAGSAAWDRFAALDTAEEVRRVAVATTATVALVGAAWPRIVQRPDGLLIVVSSLAAWQPTPYMATYAAGKAFQRSFTEALAAEAHAEGSYASVLALCPGPVDTEFAWVAGTQPLAERVPVLKPVELAREALRRAERHRGSVAYVPGWRNRVSAAAAEVLPRGLVTRISERNHRPR